MSGLRLDDHRTRTGFERRAATQPRDVIGAGAGATEDLAFEKRQRLRERQDGTSWARIVLGVVRGLIVMVRERGGRVVDRVVVEPVLPAKPSGQSVAIPHLI